MTTSTQRRTRATRRPIHRAFGLFVGVSGTVGTLLQHRPLDFGLARIVAYVSVGVLVFPSAVARAAVAVFVGALAGYYAAEAACYGSAGGSVTQQYMFCAFMLTVVSGAAGLLAARAHADVDGTAGRRPGSGTRPAC